MLLVPFVWWWGTTFNMKVISLVVGGANAMLCWLLLTRLKVQPRYAALGTLVFAFGTVNWFSAIVGTTWFLAHFCVELFLLLALLEVFGRGRGILVGLLAGFAVLARLNVLTALAGILLLLIDRHAARTGLRRFADARALRHALLFGVGVAIPLSIELALNYARFGNPFETGYAIAAQPYLATRSYGWYDWRYLPRHLHVLFFAGWQYTEGAPFLKPSPEGLSVIFTSPVLLYAFAAPWRDSRVRLLWLTVTLTLGALFPYFFQGEVQFGYRYLLDALPYLIILCVMGMVGRPRRTLLLVVTLSMLSNALGVYWEKKFGW